MVRATSTDRAVLGRRPVTDGREPETSSAGVAAKLRPRRRFPIGGHPIGRPHKTDRSGATALTVAVVEPTCGALCLAASAVSCPQRLELRRQLRSDRSPAAGGGPPTG